MTTSPSSISPGDLAFTLDPRLDKSDVWERLDGVVRTFGASVIPRLLAEREVAHPVILDLGHGELGLAYAEILSDELAQLLKQLGQVQRDLLIAAEDESLRARASALLAELGVLARVASRFTDEVLLPYLDDNLTQHEADQLQDALRTFRRRQSP